MTRASDDNFANVGRSHRHDSNANGCCAPSSSPVSSHRSECSPSSPRPATRNWGRRVRSIRSPPTAPRSTVPRRPDWRQPERRRPWRRLSRAAMPRRPRVRSRRSRRRISPLRPDGAHRGLHDPAEDDHQRVRVDRRAVPPAGAAARGLLQRRAHRRVRLRHERGRRGAAEGARPLRRRRRRPRDRPRARHLAGGAAARRPHPAAARAPRTAWGFPLSSVASTGADAPPLPENSGTGRRVVYERISQRVWAVSEDGEIIRSWLVAGSQYNNEMPGTHSVYSRSEQSTAWNGRAILPLMIRWLQTDIGHIGFHGIPIHVSDGTPYMTEAELGTAAVGRLPAPGQPRRPVHVGASPTSAPRSSSCSGDGGRSSETRVRAVAPSAGAREHPKVTWGTPWQRAQTECGP